MKFGEKISRLRRDKGYTQKQLGELVGVTQRTVAGYETENNYPKQPIQRVIIAHELGHAFLHAGLMHAGGIKCFDNRSPLRQTNQFEREANQFAAELLLTDEDVETAFRETQDLYTAAATLNVPPELLEFKLKMMKRLIRNSLH